MQERLRTEPANLSKRTHQKFISNVVERDTILTYVSNSEEQR